MPRKLEQSNAWRLLFFRCLLLFCVVSMTGGAAADGLARREWKVNGLAREALLYVPDQAKRQPVPVVFVFHGHGGTMRKAAMMFRMGQEWPQAIAVYPQGLNTPGGIVDPQGKKSGWQSGRGDQGDRDLKFFDAILASLKSEYKVDSKRVYATGHSNGGAFTYVLWATRRDQFAAFAPSAAVLPSLLGSGDSAKMDPRRIAVVGGNPKPIFHVAGNNDPLVKYEWQKTMLEGVRLANQCSSAGKPWPKSNQCVLFESKVGAPVVTLIHAGKHGFPENAPRLIVDFFQSHPSQ